MKSRQIAIAVAVAASACSGAGEQPDAGTPSTDATAPRDAGFADAAPNDAGADRDAGVGMDAEPHDSGPPPLGPVTVDLSSTRPPDSLATFNFFRFVDGEFEYNDRVVAYQLNTALFSDYSIKARAVYVPPGEAIQYRAEGALDFPVGSVIIKTFLFADDMRTPQDTLRMIETRLLVRYPDTWRAFPYLWNEAQTEATYFVRGQVQTLDFIDPFGAPRTAQYLIPQKNQCLECHELKDENDERFTTPVGPRARYLNRDLDYGAGPVNQLQHLETLGLLEGLDPIADVPRAFDWSSLATTATTSLDFPTLERAARDYLDINCAHCHRPDATQGMTSRLWVNWDNQDDFHLGFCKEPGSAGSASAGRQYDIVPGNAEASILIYRTETEVVGDMMPLLGRSVADDVAVGILRGWVDGLPPDDCED